MSRKYELTGFIPTIKKPDEFESREIIIAQLEIPTRLISCVFNVGQFDEHTVTRNPHKHMMAGMEHEIEILEKDMQAADFVQLIDTTER